MSKAQQAAEERWPSYPVVGFSGAEDRQVAFLAGVAWALPENPHPVVIEATAKVIAHAALDWIDYETDEHDHDPECSNWEAYQDEARAAYAALRGAMQ